MIKPLFESIDVVNTEKSFSVKVYEQDAFKSPYHYHPEYELTLITKGSGKRYIGNQMDNYTIGDLVFLGPNLPHCWKTEFSAENESNVSSIVVQFTNDFLGDVFFNKPEMLGIKKMLEKTRRGIVYNAAVVVAISVELNKLVEEKNSFKKLQLFLEILYKLSVTEDFNLLSRLSYIPAQSGTDLERINNVFGYIIENYRAEVSLNGVAKAACMSPNAFCKYFKKVTQKTFMEVVVEYRIHYATTQLLNTDKSVSQVCFDCGFKDTVHFISVFKLRMALSPLQYKKKFLKTFNEFDASDLPDNF